MSTSIPLPRRRRATPLATGLAATMLSSLLATCGAPAESPPAAPPPPMADASRWGSRAALLEANSEMSVAELEGLIYVIGGYPSTRISTVLVQVYDPAADRWRAGVPLPVALNHTMSVSTGGVLYVIGGQTEAGGDGPFVNTVYAFDPKVGRWVTRAPMPTARAGGAAAVVNSRIYVAGGRPPRGNDFAVYDPALDRWETLPVLPTQRNHIGAVSIGNRVYVVGGRTGAGFDTPTLDKVEVYDVTTGGWSTAAPLLRPRGGANAIVAHGLLHVFGGEGNPSAPTGVFPDHDVYDPARNAWVRLPDMPTPVHGVTGAAFLNGVIHLPGGGISSGGSSGSTILQVYRPATSYP